MPILLDNQNFVRHKTQLIILNSKGSTKNNLAELAPRFMLDSESSLTCGLRSDEDDVETGCKNVKLFFVEP